MRVRALSLLFLLAAAPGSAQQAEVGRYAFVPVERGALRLDTLTGEVSLCTVEAGTTICAAVPAPLGAPGGDSAGLEERMARLEARIAALEAAQISGGIALSDEESMDRVMVLADRMMRRFFGMVGDLKRDMESGEL